MSDYDVLIIGGGPAGSAAAIRLAASGARVLVLEEKRMPRAKLCGEFVTPECFPTLKRLGVMERTLAAGAHKLTRLRLVSSGGRLVQMPIARMSHGEDWAMGLSRYRFDQILFERAREAGAVCLEGMAVRRCLFAGDRPRGVEATRLADGRTVNFTAPLVVDASGRNSRLMVERAERVGGRQGSRLYALKGHLENVAGIVEQIELYFFPQGYGGMVRVEEGKVNLCFIANERAFRETGGDAQKIIQQTVMKNALAAERLSGFRVVGKWLTVGPLVFGRRRLSRRGVIAIGDASGMIDPFTGTGIQMALRSGEIAAEAILGAVGDGATDRAREALAAYRLGYEREFGRRMRVAGALRGAAFSPATANFIAGVFASAPWLTRSVLRATRSGSPDPQMT